MITCRVRHQIARAIPHGLSEPTADEVLRALESPRSRSSQADIDRIVRYAAATVPFYREKRPLSLADLPVTDKSMMVAEPEAFFADGISRGRLASRMSSGSSGIPFRSYFDAARIARHRAELVAGFRLLGADPFGSFVHCRPWFQASRRERVSYALRGQYLYEGATDERSVRALAGWIARRRRVTIIGLCSFLEVLFQAFEEHQITLQPSAVDVVIGVGEPASRYLAEAVPRLTGVDLAMRYSNTENGLLGFADGPARPYLLDTSTFHVEILDQATDAPAAPGTSGRIVVTDLYNRAMPFLRYDTGDLGAFAMDTDGLPLPGMLDELTGRRADVPIGGTPGSPQRRSHYALFMRADANPEIRQFQLRQHAIGHFTWVLNADPSAELEARIRRLMDEEIGGIVSCTFRYVGDVPLSQSGKKRFFINEIPEAESLLRSAAG